MPLTRYERGVLEDLMNKVLDQQKAIKFLESEVNRLNDAIVNLGGNNVLELSEEEQADALSAAIRRVLRGLNVKLHTHLSDQEGGDAFAKKGATLIEELITTEEEEGG